MARQHTAREKRVAECDPAQGDGTKLHPERPASENVWLVLKPPAGPSGDGVVSRPWRGQVIDVGEWLCP